MVKCGNVNKQGKVVTIEVPARNVGFFFEKVNGKLIVTGSISSGSHCPSFSDMPKNIKAACYRMAGAIWRDHFGNLSKKI